VGLERPLVFGLHQAQPGRLERRRHVAALHRLLALHCLGPANVLVQRVHFRERAVERMPVDLQCLCRAHRIPVARREHRDEVALAEHAHAGDALDRRLVHAAHLARRTRRADHARMQHPGQTKIGDVVARAVDLPCHVAPGDGLADHLVARHGLGLRLDLDVHQVAGLLVPLDRLVEVLSSDELGVRDRLALARHHTISHA
jgi:hypothetical protein